MNTTLVYTREQLLRAGREIQRHTPGNGFCLFHVADLSGGAWYNSSARPAYNPLEEIAVPVPWPHEVHAGADPSLMFGEYVRRIVTSRATQSFTVGTCSKAPSRTSTATAAASSLRIGMEAA